MNCGVTLAARQWSTPQYGQPPEEKLAYRSLLRSAVQQRGFGNQSAIAVMERPTSMIDSELFKGTSMVEAPLPSTSLVVK